MSNSNNNNNAELAELKAKLEAEYGSNLNREVKRCNECNNYSCEKCKSKLEDELAILLKDGSNAGSNADSNAGSNTGSNGNNNPTVPIQNTGPMNNLNILKKNNTICFLCEKKTNNLTLNNNGFTLCANCMKKHINNLGGGSKKKLTTKQKKQLKKIILLYNKIRTKLLNNK